MHRIPATTIFGRMGSGPGGLSVWKGASLEQRLFEVLAFTIPLSVKLYVVPLNLEVIFPAEPLIGLLAVLFVVRWVKGRTVPFPWRGSIQLLVIALAALGLASTLFSTLPLVSWKATTVRSAYLCVFFFGALQFNDRVRPDLRRALSAHGAGLLLVVLYATFRQAGIGFQRRGAAHMSFPFYADHTIYSAALVFVLIGAAVRWRYAEKGPFRWRSTWGAVTLLSAFACYATFTRAAWVSIVVVAVVVALYRIGLRTRGFVVLTLVALAMLLVGGRPLVHDAPFPLVDSNADHTGVKEILLSIPNLHTDASNKERVNRWLCAARMCADRPITGFGPGTYQFRYQHYQRQDWMTYLSLPETEDPGELVQYAWRMGPSLTVKSSEQIYYYSGGTAHSEYLLAAAELGVGGALLLTALFVVALLSGLRRAATDLPTEDRIWVTTAVLAVLAYAVHAFFNNYLDDCKLAFPFYGMLVLIARTGAAQESRPLSSAPR